MHIHQIMKCNNGLELSPKKSEYLKYIFEKGGIVRTTDISDNFHLDPSTITKTMQEMSSTGLIEYLPYRGISLTCKGTDYAEFLVRRHRVIELMLSHYGLSGCEACDEALKFEGYISRNVVNKICRSLGHPRIGICGRIKHNKSSCCPEEN
jgi:DtxR family transcriptional regulator, Mn-dependent transcriptional regulator